MSVTCCDFTDYVVLAITVFTIIYMLVQWKYTYWERRGLQNPEPVFVLGNLQEIITQKLSWGEKLAAIYHEMKAKGLKHAGMYFLLSPIYVPIDPDIIKRILQTDFQHFMDRGVYFDENDALTNHLFAIEGQKWKNLRAKLTPTFTSGKMKMMFSTVVETTDELIKILDKNKPSEPVEIKEVLARLTIDIIGSCALGIDCNSLKNPDTEFRKIGKRVLEETKVDQLKNFLSFLCPSFLRFFKIKVLPAEVTKFFMKVVKDTINYRETNNVQRNDFMHLLLQLKITGKVDGEGDYIQAKTNDSTIQKLTVNEIAAQAFIFFLAGFETSSTTMAFCLYELALNKDIQDKLREEVSVILKKYDGKLCYEAIGEMHYMDMVLYETLRKHPTVPVLSRICTQDYEVPELDLSLKKGTSVLIPVGGLHSDDEYYPNPNIFDPDRFSEENKRGRMAVTYLPFGDGPRICIGLRFGIMQVKVALSVLLKNYNFTLNSKTPVPLKMNPKSFISSSLGGIWLNINKINKE